MLSHHTCLEPPFQLAWLTLLLARIAPVDGSSLHISGRQQVVVECRLALGWGLC